MTEVSNGLTAVAIGFGTDGDGAKDALDLIFERLGGSSSELEDNEATEIRESLHLLIAEVAKAAALRRGGRTRDSITGDDLAACGVGVARDGREPDLTGSTSEALRGRPGPRFSSVLAGTEFEGRWTFFSTGSVLTVDALIELDLPGLPGPRLSTILFVNNLAFERKDFANADDRVGTRRFMF